MPTLNWDTDSILNRLVLRLQSKVSWSSVLPFSTNMRLLSAFAEELANLANFDAYLTRETKWSLARNTSSLLSAEAIHRYEAHRKIGASGLLRVGVSALISSAQWSTTTAYTAGTTIYRNDILYTASQNSTGQDPALAPTYWSLTNIAPAVNVDIPKWAVFTDSGGTIKFSSYTAETLTTSQNFIDIPVIQGTPKSFTATAQGIEKEEFLINDASVENNIYELYVNNVLWTKVTNLLDQTSTATAYEIENVLDFSGIYLKFGDDINGKKLTTGDVVKFNYISTDGSLNNVNSTNIITKVSYVLYNTNSIAVTAFCTNQESLLGGQDYENIESIRARAPEIFQTGDRASSSTDYKAIIESNFSFVLKANVWGSYEFNIDNGLDPWTFVPAEENVVNIAAISTGGTNLTDSQKLAISQGINQFKAPTDIVVYNAVRFLNLVFRTTAYVLNTIYTLSSVVSAITTDLSNAYSVQALDLHQNVYFSDYQTLIDGATGVDHHTTYAEIYYDFKFDSAYTASLLLPSTNLRASSVRVYVEDTVAAPGVFNLVAIDDGVGGLTAQGIYTLTNSNINYNTGDGTLQVSSGLSNPFADYNVRVYYRLAADDLLLVQRYDIYKFDANNSTISAVYIRQ